MLKVSSLSFSYEIPRSIPIQNVSFSVTEGECMAIIGQSGSGKSTLLQLIYGLLQPKKGSIHWKNKHVLGPDYQLVPGEADMKYVSQSYDLMPFTTVSENIGSYLSNIYKTNKQKKINELIKLVSLEAYRNTLVKHLSGGQKQRVAIAKALAKAPEVLLLDEPFSQLDGYLKHDIRRKLFAFIKKKGITTLISTHDTADILSYTDRTLVLEKGRKIIEAQTHWLYRHPGSLYTISLFGEYSVLPLKLFIPEEDSQVIMLYPQELEVVAHSLCKVRCCQAYFRGDQFLIHALYNEDTNLYFYYPHKLQQNEIRYLVLRAGVPVEARLLPTRYDKL